MKTETAKKIPFIQLTGQFTPLRNELVAAATKVIDSGAYILGPQVKAFEEEFARYVGSPRCLGVSSGTQALQLALESVGVGPGDEVIVPAMSFIATATAVSETGATPVFADVDPATLNLDPASVDKRLTKRTKALLPVHLYGCPADLTPLLALARGRKIAVIEDCAQAHGAEYDGKRVGSFGAVGCFSFYPTKNLGAMGDAGAVTMKDPELYDSCFTQRNIGRRAGERYNHVKVGHNYRLDEIQAAVLRVKLPHLKEWTDQRRRAAATYKSVLAGLPVMIPVEKPGVMSCYHQYVIQTPKRDALMKHLAQAQIESGVYYPIPLHLQPAYAGLGGKEGDNPEAERAAKEVLSLPMFPELADSDIDRVGSEIRRFFKK